MEKHFIVVAAGERFSEWRFLAGLDNAKHPIWADAGEAARFSTFQQARRVARRLRGVQIFASFSDSKEATQ
ncbi:hypothetical protein [uncultured Pigmentiphaga sp.]|uniref:hypothetical protein n=1 Tax=uncultured Pigmentiphaga sp. TaxID=340361 RepID=UPI001354CEB6|nr:hypothetical protein [uncultured Pigmentiphaga sp.]EDH5293469.1 hypothetical protein [Salmonella enterica subsp. enterica serovar Senftenberg]EDI2310962.1 hypothetical protein [Salmonella enterica subsp. enterica serovar Senftenberg]